MRQTQPEGPENTAERVALWRALHVLVDPPPHVLVDEIGLQLLAPPEGWRQRPDMDPRATAGFRASVVGRARFIEEIVAEQAGRGVRQYVILGAGLDTFAQRRPDRASSMHVFEIDQPGPQTWKRRRLIELGFGIPEWLRLVPVNFESDPSWKEQLLQCGFDVTQPAVVAATGVTMYLTRDATSGLLREVASLAAGTTFAMTFLLPIELIDERDRAGLRTSQQGAQASGTPFVSFYSPDEMLALARAAGFQHVRHVSGRSLGERYFGGRSDGLRPSTGEDFLVAST